MDRNNQKLVRAMTMLGVQLQDFRAIEQAPSDVEAQRRLDDLKTRVRRRWKVLAQELHPDKTGDDPAKTEDFKLVASVVEEICKSTFQVRPPRPPPRPPVHLHNLRIVFVSGPSSRAQYSTSANADPFGFRPATASTVGWGWPKF